MPLIIVATDFSAIADNAVRYAADLAGDWGCTLLLAHAYFMPVSFNDPAMPILPPDDMMNVAKDRMARAVNGVQQRMPQLQVSTHIAYGEIQDVLEGLIGKEQPLLVVAASHGEGDAGLWMGSTTLDLLRHTKCPVLAVPPTAAFRPVKQCCLALDLAHPDERLQLDALQVLLARSGAGLHLLHVSREDEAASYTLPPLPEGLQHLNASLHEAQTTGSVDEKIAEFCEQRSMDWLAVIPHRHSFWEGLFHKSHTKEVVRISPVPVLALHEEA